MTSVAERPVEAIAPALFQSLSIDGVYARTAPLERVIEGLNGLISRNRPPGAEIFRFPPVMSRAQLEKMGYPKSFPQLLGGVCCLHSGEGTTATTSIQKAGDWVTTVAPSELVLTPAACYPVYPLAAARGRLPEGGLMFDVAADCFRREPSKKYDRLQSFRMREFVCIGSAEQAIGFREKWIGRAKELADQLRLEHRTANASDPFFGRAGKMLAMSQVEQALKFELLVPVYSEEQATACMSFNYHQQHFGSTWGLRGRTGEEAHTACVAFGLDRLALALFATHGLDLQRWPQAAREALNLGA